MRREERQEREGPGHKSWRGAAGKEVLPDFFFLSFFLGTVGKL